MTATSHDTAFHVVRFFVRCGTLAVGAGIYGHMSNADVLRLAVFAGDASGRSFGFIAGA